MSFLVHSSPAAVSKKGDFRALAAVHRAAGSYSSSRVRRDNPSDGRYSNRSHSEYDADADADADEYEYEFGSELEFE